MESVREKVEFRHSGSPNGGLSCVDVVRDASHLFWWDMLPGTVTLCTGKTSQINISYKHCLRARHDPGR